MTTPAPTSPRMPTLFISHGGGPWPWMDYGDANPFAPLAEYLRGIPASLPSPPKAILMVSGHWEAPAFTVMTHPQPPMLHDYGGFPEHTYRIRYPAPGAPQLALRARALLQTANLSTAEDAQRGFDHGAFTPLAVSYPEARIPVAQLSLNAGYRPEDHLAAGRALAPLRDEGVLIIGSGLSYHNLRALFGGRSAHTDPTADSLAFDTWLTAAVCSADPQDRNRRLAQWATAPAARKAHPREDHLLPLLVAAGAAGADVGHKVFSDQTAMVPGAGIEISGFQFG